MSVPPPTTPVLQEDDPGWDCTTMGNLICGPGHGYNLPHTGSEPVIAGTGLLFLLAGTALLLAARRRPRQLNKGLTGQLSDCGVR
jgi:LPXTG-motif cell wall-anchored protein